MPRLPSEFCNDHLLFGFRVWSHMRKRAASTWKISGKNMVEKERAVACSWTAGNGYGHKNSERCCSSFFVMKRFQTQRIRSLTSSSQNRFQYDLFQLMMIIIITHPMWRSCVVNRGQIRRQNMIWFLVLHLSRFLFESMNLRWNECQTNLYVEERDSQLTGTAAFVCISIYSVKRSKLQSRIKFDCVRRLKIICWFWTRCCRNCSYEFVALSTNLDASKFKLEYSTIFAFCSPLVFNANELCVLGSENWDTAYGTMYVLNDFVCHRGPWALNATFNLICIYSIGQQCIPFQSIVFQSNAHLSPW